MAEPKQGGDATAFIQEYGPIAEKIGADIGVDPKIILAKFGLETGWGKSVIPGTYNLGNIKDFSGAGVKAYDKREKSNDAYMKFEDPETFAAYYSDFMKRMYPKAIGAGSDVDAFTTGLNKGVRGPYATAENYPSAIRNAYSLVNARIESAQPKQDDEFGFGTGPTEGQRIAQEPPSPPVEREGVVNKEDAALAGAGAGLAAGIVAGNTKQPTSPRLDAARERLQVARDKLDEVRSRAGTGVSLDDLEDELRTRKFAAQQAAEELRVAQEELRATSRTAPSTASAAADVADDLPGRKVPGASGASNWVRAMGQDVPDVVAETAENMRKDNPKGGQAIIDRDVAAKQKIQQLGAGDYKLTGQGKGQLMLPPDLAAEKTAALEGELSQRQAADAAERTRLAQEAEAKRIAAERRVAQARQARAQTGTAVGDVSQQAKQARQAQTAAQKAESGVSVAEKALERAGSAKPGALGQIGAATAKVAPKALGVISGAATGMAAMEAIEKFKQGDYSGAVLPTLEATFGVMSMLPPAHPILLALRGLGTAGGAALMGYEGYKAVRGEPQTEK
jgi:hypothetical protein